MLRQHSKTAILIGLFACLAPGHAIGQQTAWFSPLGMTPTPGTPVTIEPASPPFGPVQAVHITSSAVGLFFVHLGLALPSDVLIDSVCVCYELASVANFITQTRLTRMRTPDAALVVLDDPTDRNTSTLECYAVNAGEISVSGAITLSLRLDFTNTTDWIEIGGVAIKTVSAVAGVEEQLPAPDHAASSLLKQNRPNPFKPSTVIEYELERTGNLQLRIHNALGRIVRTLVDEDATPGSYSIEWDGRDDRGRPLPSGVYYYQLTVGGLEESKHMILLK